MGVWVEDARVRYRFKYMNQNMRNMTETLRWAGRELSRDVKESFATRGHGTWEPLDAEYARWKAKNYGPNPVLVASGEMRLDLLNMTRNSSTYLAPHSARFGTTVDYAKYHQAGTRFMPQRKVLRIPPGFEERLARRVGDDIVHGTGNRT